MSFSGAPLPSGWVAIRDPASGRFYFFNQATNQTTWTPPVPTAAPAGTFAGPQQAPLLGGPALPPGWQKAIDPRTGRVFYIDHLNKATSWTAPTSAAQPQPQQPPQTQHLQPSQGQPQQQQQLFPQQQLQPVPFSAMPSPTGLPQPTPVTSLLQPGPAQPGQITRDSKEPSLQEQQEQKLPAGSPQPLALGSAPPASSQPPPMPQQQTPPQWGSSTFFGAVPGYAPYSYPMPGAQMGQPNPYAPMQQVGPVPGTMAGPGAMAMPGMGMIPMQSQPQPQQGALAVVRPLWTAPVNQTNCLQCGVAFGTILKRKVRCACCQRDFCDACMQKKANVTPQESGRVCNPCFSHLSKSNPKCLSKLIPYLSEPREDLKFEALREINEMISQDSAALNVDDVRGCGLVTALRAQVALLSPATAPAAAALLRALTTWPALLESLTSDASACARALVEGLGALLSQPPGRAVSDMATISAMAVRQSQAVRTAMVSAHALRTSRRALESTDEGVRHAAAMLVESLSSETSPCGEKDDEAATVFSLVAALQQAPDSVMAPTIISALTNLAARDENRMALKEEGIQVLVKVLESQNAQTVKNGLVALSRLCSSPELCPQIARSIGPIAKVMSSESSSPDLRRQAFSVICSLSRSDSSREIVTEALLFDHQGALAAALSSDDVEQQRSAAEIVATALQNPRHAEVIFGIVEESHLIEPLMHIASARSPASPLALRAVALASQRSQKNGEQAASLGVIKLATDMISAGTEPGVTEAARALWCLCAVPAVVASFASNAEAVLAVGVLLTSPSAPLRQAACGIIANAGHQVSERLVRDTPALPVLAAMAAAHQADADGSANALRALASLCDGPEKDEVSERVRATVVAAGQARLASTLVRGAPPAVQYHSLSLLAALSKSPASRSGVDLSAVASIASSTTDMHIRERAYTAICRFANDDSGIAALRRARALPVFVEMLFSKDDTSATSIRVQAATAIGRIAELSEAGAAEYTELISLGAMIALLSLVSDENPVVSRAGCGALASLATHSETWMSNMISEHAPEVVAEVITKQGSSPETLSLVRAICSQDHGARAFVDAGGVTPLAKFSASGDESCIEAVAVITRVCPRAWDCVVTAVGPVGLLPLASSQKAGGLRVLAVASITALAQQNPEGRDELAAAGAVRVLAEIVRSTAQGEPSGILDAAVSGCAALIDAPNASAQLDDQTVVEAFVRLLACPVPKIRDSASVVVAFLAGAGEAQLQIVIAAGAIPHYVRSLSIPDTRTVVAALSTLQRIAASGAAGAAAVFSGEAILPLMGLLRTEHAAGALNTLLNLSKTPAARAAIAASDAFYDALAPMISSTNVDISQSALTLVTAVASEASFGQHLAASASTAALVVSLLSSASPVAEVLEMVCSAMSSTRSRRALVAAGVLTPLTSLATSNVKAMEALAHGARDEAVRQAFPESGLAATLSAALDPTDPRCPYAARLLAGLVVSARHRSALFAPRESESESETMRRLSERARGGDTECIAVLAQVVACPGAVYASLVADGTFETVLSALLISGAENVELARSASQFLLAAMVRGEDVSRIVCERGELLAQAALRSVTAAPDAATNILLALRLVAFDDKVRAALEQVLPEFAMAAAGDAALRAEVARLSALVGTD